MVAHEDDQQEARARARKLDTERAMQGVILNYYSNCTQSIHYAILDDQHGKSEMLLNMLVNYVLLWSKKLFLKYAFLEKKNVSF